VPLLGRGDLEEIIFVDDASTDDTTRVVQEYPVRLLRGRGEGPGSARNIGWQAAQTEFVWFLDADCVAEPKALAALMAMFRKDESLAGAGGTYGNAQDDSLLVRLIHEEIRERHLNMSAGVDFLATFNVVYRREALERLGGFDERFKLGQDAEFAYRVVRAGGKLGFTLRSRVNHYHESRFLPYLYKQFRQGYTRVRLYRCYPEKMSGDSYSGLWDHVQPPLALLILGCAPFSVWPTGRALLAMLVSILLICQVPMTWRLVRRTGKLHYLSFGMFSALRSFWRGFGMTAGVLIHLRGQSSMRQETGPQA
jgi:glycosyltransferase involved in cell wall biosynthesis